MVETVMIFALGFLAAALLALLFIPAINARAERLARRRAEALFPMSISELSAEKDHLRAEFAVLQRRIERKAEEAQAVKHQSMEELGRRALRIDALETELAGRDAAAAGLQKDLDETGSRLANTESELESTKALLAATRETLTAIEEAHRKTLDELASTRGSLESSKSGMAEVRAELVQTHEKLEVRDSAFVALEASLNAALSELDAKRITISDLETRLATQTARGDDFERALGDRRGELTDERQRLADLAKSLLAEQERSLVLQQRTREIEAERDAKAAEAAALASRVLEITAARDALQSSLEERSATHAALQKKLEDSRGRIGTLEAGSGKSDVDHASALRSLSERTEILKAEKASLEGALALAREERARLEHELQALRRSGGEDLRADNAELRQQITKVADEIMRAAAGRNADSKKRRSSGR